MTLQDVRNEFDTTMWHGISLLLATVIGSTKEVIVVIQNSTLTWRMQSSSSQRASPKPIGSVSLRTILNIEMGMSKKLDSLYIEEIHRRSFTIHLRKESVSFIAPTTIERDALFNGFKSLLEIGDEYNICV